MPDLSQILAAGPLAPAEMQAQIYGAGAADPRLLGGEGPVGQALGQLTATFAARPQAMDAAQQIAQGQTGAMGDLSAAYASPDPFQWVAQHPEASPVAKWSILRSTPEQVAQARNLQSETQLRLPQVSFRQNLPGMLNKAFNGFPQFADGAGTNPATGVGRDTSGMATIEGAQPSGAAFPDRGVDLGSGQAAPPDMVARLPADRTQMKAYLQRLPPWQQTLLRQQLLLRGYPAAAQ